MHPGGASITVPSIANFMAGQGHQVFYFGRNSPSPLEHGIIEKNIELRYLQELPEFLYYPSMPLRAYRLLKDRFSEFDVVHAHIGSFAFAASRLKKRNPKVKFFITVHDIEKPGYEPSLKGKLYLRAENLLMKTACKRANAVIVRNNYMKEQVKKEWGIENCIAIRDGVDANFSKPVAIDKEQQDKLWGDAKHRLLFVGRTEYRKGVVQLIESAKYLLEDGLSFRLVIVGDSKLQSSLKKLISNLELGSYVHLYGRAEEKELPSLYSSAHLTIVPSLYEPFGIVPLESLACGTPVIVSGNTGMKETIGDEIGYFIPEVTPASIASTIRNVIGSSLPSPESCRQFVSQRYDWRDIYPLYEELFCNS